MMVVERLNASEIQLRSPPPVTAAGDVGVGYAAIR
jgi:hypothetical protein